MSPPWSQTQIDELRAAIASVVLTVNYSGPPARSITYQSLEEMKKTLAMMISENNLAAGGRSYVFAATRKGV